jgi:hypothetical protein
VSAPKSSRRASVDSLLLSDRAGSGGSNQGALSPAVAGARAGGDGGTRAGGRGSSELSSSSLGRLFSGVKSGEPAQVSHAVRSMRPFSERPFSEWTAASDATPMASDDVAPVASVSTPRPTSSPIAVNVFTTCLPVVRFASTISPAVHQDRPNFAARLRSRMGDIARRASIRPSSAWP